MKKLNEINREIGEAMEAERQEYETGNNEWWNHQIWKKVYKDKEL